MMVESTLPPPCATMNWPPAKGKSSGCVLRAERGRPRPRPRLLRSRPADVAWTSAVSSRAMVHVTLPPSRTVATRERSRPGEDQTARCARGDRLAHCGNWVLTDWRTRIVPSSTLSASISLTVVGAAGRGQTRPFSSRRPRWQLLVRCVRPRGLTIWFVDESGGCRRCESHVIQVVPHVLPEAGIF
jgi:hypothetical protein